MRSWEAMESVKALMQSVAWEEGNQLPAWKNGKNAGLNRESREFWCNLEALSSKASPQPQNNILQRKLQVSQPPLKRNFLRLQKSDHPLIISVTTRRIMAVVSGCQLGLSLPGGPEFESSAPTQKSSNVAAVFQHSALEAQTADPGVGWLLDQLELVCSLFSERPCLKNKDVDCDPRRHINVHVHPHHCMSLQT